MSETKINEQLKTIYKAIDDKLGMDIVVIDFNGQSAYYDYFIITTSKNNNHAASISDAVIEAGEKLKLDIKNKPSNNDSSWYLIDLGDIIVHIFNSDSRKLYNLEGLWSDMKRVEVNINE